MIFIYRQCHIELNAHRNGQKMTFYIDCTLKNRKLRFFSHFFPSKNAPLVQLQPRLVFSFKAHHFTVSHAQCTKCCRKLPVQLA